MDRNPWVGVKGMGVERLRKVDVGQKNPTNIKIRGQDITIKPHGGD